MGRKPIDLAGRRFGRLTVERRSDAPRGAGLPAKWLVRCDCGELREVVGHKLVTGEVTHSCGCEKIERLRDAATVHGHGVPGRHTRTYESWLAMRQRCLNPNAHAFEHYGGRGIAICDQWLASFASFLEDMGERPEGRTLDRFPDPNGNYEPGNCRWATPFEQTHNRRAA